MEVKNRISVGTDTQKVGRLRKELDAQINQLQEHLSIIAAINAHLGETFKTRAEVDEFIKKLGYKNLSFGADSQGFKNLYDKLAESTRPTIAEDLIVIKGLTVRESKEALDIIRLQSTEYVHESLQENVEKMQDFIEFFGGLTRQEQRALSIHNGQARLRLESLCYIWK